MLVLEAVTEEIQHLAQLHLREAVAEEVTLHNQVEVVLIGQELVVVVAEVDSTKRVQLVQEHQVKETMVQ
jgi:hypothetical protein